jgi:L-alanine-DL-glutamate epimerase-like enolase superfamily enzyme
MSTYGADISAEVLHRQVAPTALGADPLDVDALVDRIYEDTYKFPGTYVCRAVAGLDSALWDLKGKLEGKAVCELLGGQVRPIAAYGSSMRRDIPPADEAARLAKLRDERGYRAFKIRIGSVCGHDADQWPGRTDELVPTCRQAIGDDVALLVDGNSCYTAPKAIAVGRMLEDNGVIHFEEPCPYWELEWTAEVTAALDCPVAGGEQDNYMPTWKRIVELPAVDIVQPDVCYLGGICRTLRVAKMAAERGLACTPHSANRSMVTLFTMHLLAAIDNAGEFLEFSIEPTPWADGLFDPALEARDGAVPITGQPGWGVTVRADWLERADRRVSELD